MAVRPSSKENLGLAERGRADVQHACTVLGLRPYPDSIATWDDLAFAMVHSGGQKRLLLLSADMEPLAGFHGTRYSVETSTGPTVALLCPLSADNGHTLRSSVPSLAPVVLTRGPSIGTGDRIGLATPGHARALRNRAMAPVFAQQSVRELSRIQRSMHEVVDNAMWGVVQAGYHAGYAADADHLKSVADLDRAIDAGFTMFTADPGEFVADMPERLDADDLNVRLDALPWDILQCTLNDCCRRYANRKVTIAGRRAEFALMPSAQDVMHASVKYGRAIAHTVELYRHLTARSARDAFVFEVAVDETATPTTAAEHYYIASELKRLGVQWDSIAPRFVGRFLKGVDYVGDLEQFRVEFRKHVLLAEHLGGYKLSLHSGSDKFSIYPLVAELADGAIHIKTSGTSYLEALRVIGTVAPDLFREVLRLSKQRYVADAGDYHVGASVSRVVDPDGLREEELPDTLDQPDTRQACHVTFGSVLSDRRDDGRPPIRDRLLSVLSRNEDLYYRRLEEHFARHIAPFV